MIKVITGAPRSGKTYFAVHHVLHTYFKWDSNLFKWVPLSDKIPFILTNVDGLLVPHHRLDQFLSDIKLTLPQFLTLRYFVPWLDTIDGRPVVLILDESHGPFPANFKDPGSGDPQTSTFFFFGYHGHYPIDIYLITHSWTDLCPSIANRSEFQIDAERRSLSVTGEFRYFYLHPKTREQINKQTIRSDPRIHMSYLSSSGEHRSNEINP